MKEISIILPAYQEAENLKKILPAINKILFSSNIDYEVIVVDTTNEMDNTKAICLENKCKYINRKNTNTYGEAIRTGIESCDSKYTIFMDADGSHNPLDIPRLYKEIVDSKFDLVIGSRYCEGGKTENNFTLILMSKILNIAYSTIFKIKVKDFSNSFRIYKTYQLKKIRLECDNFDIVEELLIKLFYSKDNYCISEIPICFCKRDKGVSKRNLIKFIFSYITTINKLLQIKKSYCLEKENEQ